MENLIVCIPVKAVPNFKTSYSLYENVPCPDCGEGMWLGQRSKIQMNACMKATCAFCSVTKHGVSEEDLVGIQKLTDYDKQA